MPANIPPTHLKLLQGPITVALATLMPSGQPQVNPVWCSFEDGLVCVNSAKGRAKDRNMRERPQVTILALDPNNSLYWVEIRGKVVEVIDGQAADDHIDDLSEAYTGTRPYPYRTPNEQRVLYKIEPIRVVTMGPD